MVRKLTGRRSSPSASALRYFVYISDAKLDQLFAQVPVKLVKKITVDASVDIKVIQLTLKQNPVEENRIGRLRVVEDFIRKSVELGSVDDPRQWIQGTMNLRWGPLPEQGTPTGADATRYGVTGSGTIAGANGALDYVDSSVVFFVGKTERNYFGMCGSMRHVLGVAPETPKNGDVWTVGSAPFAFASHLEWLLGQPIDLNQPSTASNDLSNVSPDGLPLPEALRLVQTNWKKGKTSQQKLTFLAKRLSYLPGTVGDETFPPTYGGFRGGVLATPLFVSQDD